MTECAFPFSVILSYILSFQDANDIKVTLKDIIGNESVANRIATEILKSRGQVRFLLIIYHLLVGCQGRTNNCIKVKTIRRKQRSERVNTTCNFYLITAYVQTQSISSNAELVKEDNPNTVPSTVAKDIKKSDEKVEFSHPVKSSIIRNPSHTRIPCSKSKMSLSWNKASCVIQLHGMWQHHLQGGGVGGLHVLWCLQSELQTQIQKRKGRRSVEESNREQGGFHSSNFRDRTACFSMTEIIQRVLKCMEYRRE